MLLFPVADVCGLLPTVDFGITVSHCTCTPYGDQDGLFAEHRNVHAVWCSLNRAVQFLANPPDAANPLCCCLHKFDAVRRGVKGASRFNAFMVTGDKVKPQPPAPRTQETSQR